LERFVGPIAIVGSTYFIICPFPRLGRTLVANLAELSSEDGRRKTCVIR
jgi:hypothetical protein